MGVGLSKALSDALAQRREENRFRTLRAIGQSDPGFITVDGARLANFAGNDYLGLSGHPDLKKRASEYIEHYGVGSTASRLLAGNNEMYERIESKLAKMKGAEAALIFPSGFQANATVLPALSALQSCLFAADRLVHASLASGLVSSSARWFRFGHNDLAELERRLSSPNGQGYSRRVIVTESVFSMDGDIADINALSLLADRTRAELFVDEAHATGVLGESGMGLACGLGKRHVVMGTFGKALGSSGAYIACSAEMKDYLINFCSGFIFSTGLPPPVLGAIDAALDVVPGMGSQRKHLADLSSYLRARLGKLGFDTGKSVTQIVPVVVGSEARALSLAGFLEQRGFYAPAIRPPTVPNGECRVRISLCAAHTNDLIDSLLNAMADWYETQT